MMKVSYIISDIDKAVYFEDTAAALRQSGVSVCYILINCEKGELNNFLDSNGYKVYNLNCSKISKSFSTILKCRKILKTEKPDLVHCHLAMANWVGLLSSYTAGIKSRIFTRHSGEPLNISWKEKFIDKIQNRLCTKVVAISGVIEDLLKSQSFTTSKIRLIHHGFKLEKFKHLNETDKLSIKDKYNKNDNTPLIGVIARWMKWKGIQDTIAAFKIILDEHPKAKLCLFGATDNADYSKEIKSLLNELNPENIEVVQFEKNVHAIYSLFDVYIHVPVNNNCEAFGQTYVEALAAKCPSVFTLSGIANEFIVHGKNAHVVGYNSPEQIADATIKILENNNYRQNLIQHGEEIVYSMFNFDKYIKALISLYNENID